MNEERKFTTEESKFFFGALFANGCYNEAQNIKCPYWDVHRKSADGTDGDCTLKPREKICVLLQETAKGESVLTVRRKTIEDVEEEKKEQLNDLKQEVDNLAALRKQIDDKLDLLSVKLNQIE